MPAHIHNSKPTGVVLTHIAWEGSTLEIAAQKIFNEAVVKTNRSGTVKALCGSWPIPEHIDEKAPTCARCQQAQNDFMWFVSELVERLVDMYEGLSRFGVMIYDMSYELHRRGGGGDNLLEAIRTRRARWIETMMEAADNLGPRKQHFS